MLRGKSLAIGVAVASLFAAPSLAQQAPGPLKLTVHSIRGQVYWVEGGVSNAGFVVGDKGVVVIDAQRSVDAAKAMMAEIAKITPKPVNAVITTHSDPDHVGGLPAYPAGSEIIAQENTKATIIASANDPNGGPLFGPMYRDLAAHYLPTHTVGDSETRVIDGVKMELLFIAPGHSSGDLIVYLPAQKTVFAGDVLLTSMGAFPVIHIGGNSIGWIKAVKAMLALDATTYISGHGGIETKAQLRERLRVVEERRAAIKTMVEQGRSLDEIEQTLPEAGGSPMFPSFAHSTYDELTKGYPTAVAPWENMVKKK